jgi:hypothetical protein
MDSISLKRLNLTDHERNEKTVMFPKYEQRGSESKRVFKSGPDTDNLFSDFARSMNAINHLYRRTKVISYQNSEYNPRRASIQHFKHIQKIKECRILWEEFGLKPLTLPAIWRIDVFQHCPLVLRGEIRQFLVMWKVKGMPESLNNYVIDRIVDQHVVMI